MIHFRYEAIKIQWKVEELHSWSLQSHIDIIDSPWHVDFVWFPYIVTVPGNNAILARQYPLVMYGHGEKNTQTKQNGRRLCTKSYPLRMEAKWK